MSRKPKPISDDDFHKVVIYIWRLRDFCARQYLKALAQKAEEEVDAISRREPDMAFKA